VLIEGSGCALRSVAECLSAPVHAWCSFSSYMCGTCTELPLWVCRGAPVCAWCSFLSYAFATLAPNGYFGCGSVWLGAPVRARCLFSAFFAVLGCSWLLLAAPGCSWLLLAASGCSWLLLAAIDVKSRSKENNLFGVLRWNHTSTVLVLVRAPVPLLL
jgi:hypothetical protein